MAFIWKKKREKTFECRCALGLMYSDIIMCSKYFGAIINTKEVIVTYSTETSMKSRGDYAQSELVPDCIYNYEPMFICVG